MASKQIRGTILIVDDTPANLDLLSNILRGAEYKVRPATNGKLALRAAQNDPPELILLDISMPEMDGFEVCRHLKDDEQLKEIPVLFISALTDTADKIEAFKVGGLDYITKPFQPEEVLARVSTHLQNRRYQIELVEKSIALQNSIDQLKLAQDNLVQAEKMASLGVLTAGIAHEINNPINFIKTSVYALKKDIDDIECLLEASDACINSSLDQQSLERYSTIKEDVNFDVLEKELPVLVNNISMGIERTELVINGLKTYARPDENTKEATDISELIDSALVLLESRYKKKVEIRKSYVDTPEVMVQPGRMVQVLINVVGNALDALSEKTGITNPCVEIKVTSETFDGKDATAVRVIDNGPGISDAIKSKVFDPFFTTKDVGKGLGLGMYISYGIIRDHGGRIEINNREEGGVVVEIVIPMNREKIWV